MSRAFVKEPDGEQAGDDALELPISSHSNYVTPSGLAALRARLNKLLDERRALEAEDGALASQVPLSHAKREIHYLEARLGSAILIDPAKQPADEVAFGADVDVVDEDDKPHHFAIVGEDEADVAAGKVSWVSPLARALLGAKVGDAVVWPRPAGDLELEVTAIHYGNG